MKGYQTYAPPPAVRKLWDAGLFKATARTGGAGLAGRWFQCAVKGCEFGRTGFKRHAYRCKDAGQMGLHTYNSHRALYDAVVKAD